MPCAVCHGVLQARARAPWSPRRCGHSPGTSPRAPRCGAACTLPAWRRVALLPVPPPQCAHPRRALAVALCTACARFHPAWCAALSCPTTMAAAQWGGGRSSGGVDAMLNDEAKEAEVVLRGRVNGRAFVVERAVKVRGVATLPSRSQRFAVWERWGCRKRVCSAPSLHRAWLVGPVRCLCAAQRGQTSRLKFQLDGEDLTTLDKRKTQVCARKWRLQPVRARARAVLCCAAGWSTSCSAQLVDVMDGWANAGAHRPGAVHVAAAPSGVLGPERRAQAARGAPRCPGLPPTMRCPLTLRCTVNRSSAHCLQARAVAMVAVSECLPAWRRAAVCVLAGRGACESLLLPQASDKESKALKCHHAHGSPSYRLPLIAAGV